MDTLKDFFSTAPYLAWSAVSVVLAMVVIAANWPLVRWWWHNTWYSFPLIGKIARFSKDSNRDTVQKEWFKAEKTLCRDYKQFIRIQDEYDFNEKNTYLSKAGDLGRRSTPGLIWVLNVALVFVEAMGFSYVLAGYTVPGASENMQQMGALGIAFLVSVLLVALTHESGHITFRNTQINFARKEWIEAGRTGKLSTGTMALAKPQGEDDHLPNHVQLCNRVGTVPSYLLPISTAVFVVAVAMGAFYVRGQVMEKMLQQQVTGQTNEAQATSKSSSNDVLNMSTDKSNQALTLPSEDAAANQRAVKKAIADEADIDRHGGWGTFVVLTFIFVFLQILGVFFGFKWGFAGRESKAAFEAVGAGRAMSRTQLQV